MHETYITIVQSRCNYNLFCNLLKLEMILNVSVH